MASTLYPKYKEALLAGSGNVSLNVDTTTDGPYVSLYNADALAYSASHDFYDDITSAIIGPSDGARITGPSVTSGVFDGADVVFSSVAPAASVEAVVIYRHNSGGNSTWRLAMYIDTLSGLPITPNGGNITIVWHSTGICLL